MQNKKLGLSILSLLTTISTMAGGIDTVATQAYIMQYKDIAVKEMLRVGVPASITLAQGIHESSIGKSYLAEHTNNHFGIKCHESWTGKTFKYTDDAPDECFRVYDKTEDSYRDHSDFLRNRPRYAALFELQKDDYKSWAQGLKKAGYATNPKYADILIRTIEGFQLDLFDRGETPNYSAQEVTPVVIKCVEKERETKQIPTEQPAINTNPAKPAEKKIDVPLDMQSDMGKTTSVGGKSGVEKIVKLNKRKTVLVANGESLELIGKILDIPAQDLLAYNDLTDANIIKGGQLLFIEKKRRRSSSEAYVVKEGDNLWSIAQKRGIQLTVLRQHNKLKSTEEPAVGEIIYLRGYIHSKPKLKGEGDTLKAPVVSAVAAPEEKTPDFEKIRDTATPVSTTIEEPVKTSSQETNQTAPVADTKAAETPVVAPATETKTVYPAVIEYDKLPKSSNGMHTVVKGDTMYNICKRYAITVAQIMQWNNLPDQNIKLGQVLKIQP